METHSVGVQNPATRDVVRALLDKVIVCDEHERRQGDRFAAAPGWEGGMNWCVDYR